MYSPDSDFGLYVDVISPTLKSIQSLICHSQSSLTSCVQTPIVANYEAKIIKVSDIFFFTIVDLGWRREEGGGGFRGCIFGFVYIHYFCV